MNGRTRCIGYTRNILLKVSTGTVTDKCLSIAVEVIFSVNVALEDNDLSGSYLSRILFLYNTK